MWNSSWNKVDGKMVEWARNREGNKKALAIAEVVQVSKVRKKGIAKEIVKEKVKFREKKLQNSVVLAGMVSKCERCLVEWDRGLRVTHPRLIT